MTEIYPGESYDIFIQAYIARYKTDNDDYNVYGSSLADYSETLKHPEIEGFEQRMSRLQAGIFLDIGYSLRMLTDLKEIFPLFSYHGLGIMVLPEEKVASRQKGIALIEGNLFRPPEELNRMIDNVDVLVSKNTFTQFDGLNELAALEYCWKLLKYSPDLAKTGAAYIHTPTPYIFKKDRTTDFPSLCEIMRQEGFGIYPHEGLTVLVKSKPEPMRFPVHYSPGVGYFLIED